MTAGDALTAPIDIGAEVLPPFVRLPDLALVFARRAERCRELAEGHPLGPYLRFIADLAAAQDAALRQPLTVPGAAGPQAVGVPPLDKATWRGEGAWLAALRAITRRLADAAMPGPARAVLAALDRRDDDALTALGERALTGGDGGAGGGIDPGAACFLNAAFEVAWTRAAALLDAERIERLHPAGRCPVCGSAPVASVVHAVSGLDGVRFLHCALCSTEWHYVRVKCANCTSTKGIAYQQIEGAGGAVKAETCDECGTYTKILYLQNDPRLEPVADDLASYGLDILVEEAGWRRAAANPFLVPTAEAGDGAGQSVPGHHDRD